MLHPNDLIVTQYQQELRRAARQQQLVRVAQSSHPSRLYPLALIKMLRTALRRPAAPTLNARHAR
jgi:hypothetical protein